MASGSDRDLQPRLNHDPDTLAGFPPGHSATSDTPSLPPLRSLGSRARAPLTSSNPSTSRASRYRPSDADRHLRFRSGPGYPEHILQNLNSYPARPVAGFVPHDFTMPRPPSVLSQPVRNHELDDEGRPYKRRKVIQDRMVPGFKGFHYGKYGQVEPGPLTMEIMSCDGGLYADEHKYPPENILKNDSSVYCTKSNRCNIVLKHQGGTIFSLQELVIKAPGSKFSCPIREGMVFVAMESDELLTRTAQYQIQYLPSRAHRRGTVIFRHEDDGTGITRLQSSRPFRAFSYSADDDDEDDDDDDDEDDGDSRTAQIPPEFAGPPLPYTVTTVCSEDESEDDHAPGHPGGQGRRRRPSHRRGAFPFDSDSDDSIQISFGTRVYRSWPDPAEIEVPSSITISSHSPHHPYTFRAGGAASSASHANTGGRLNVAGMTLEQAREASQIATQEAVRAVGGELMTPLAHFFIEKDKNKCTIRFDPPVTGRYLLLKMWSPHQDPQKNIDIQAVIAKGFAGPRYAPSVDLA